MDDFKFVPDSCCDLPDELSRYFRAEMVPFSMLLENVNYIDDAALDMTKWLAAMAASRHTPKSACPSPEAFAEKFRKAMNVFSTTISSKLSGSYNSALLACNMVESEGTGRRAHVFDSKSASAGQIAVCIKIKECIEDNLDFDATVKKVSAFVEQMKTYFILENLDTLIKNGRMSRIVGYVASALSLRPIMCAIQGEILLCEKARGSVRAFTRLVDIIGECCTDFADRTLVITHCNNENQARFIQAEARKRYNFKDVLVARCGGLSGMYANDGGVIIAF